MRRADALRLIALDPLILEHVLSLQRWWSARQLRG
jgi:hypothetical protein